MLGLVVRILAVVVGAVLSIAIGLVLAAIFTDARDREPIDTTGI